MKNGTSETEVVVNPGFTEILGTDAKEDSNKSFGKGYFEYRKKWNE